MNKFLILIAASLCIYNVSIAQTEKGNQTAGLYVGYSGSSYTDNTLNVSTANSYDSKMKNTNLQLGPLFSYFIADKADLGASFSLNSFTTSSRSPDLSTAESTNHNKNYEALIYARKYFLYANKIGIRTGPYVGYAWSNQGYGYQDSQSDNVLNQKSHGYEAGALLEAVYFPSKRLGISAMVANFQYEHFKSKTTTSANIEQTDGSNLNFNFTDRLVLSFFYVFGH